MEGNKESKKRRIASLEKKKRRVEQEIKDRRQVKKEAEKKLQNLKREFNGFKKQRLSFIKKRKALEKRVDFLLKKEKELRKKKGEIEERERKENDAQKKRAVEKERWVVEEKRRGVEEKKWKNEDLVQKINLKIRQAEKSITEKIKPQKKVLSKKIKDTEAYLDKKERWINFLEKKIALEKKKKGKDLFTATRDLNEGYKEEEEKKQKEKREEDKLIRKIREKAKREDRERKKQERERRMAMQKKKKEDDKKIKELFDVISENKKQIESLKKELEEKEKESEKKKDSQKKGKEKEESLSDLSEKRQIELIKQKVKEEHDKLKEREDALRSKEGQKAIADAAQDKMEEEKKQIDFIRERVREEQKRFQEMSAPGQVIIKETPIQSSKEPPSYTRPSQEKESPESSKKNEELSHSEAEALFKKAEQSFHAGSFNVARARFQRIVDGYTPPESKSFLNKIKGKPLDERAAEYLSKIEEKTGFSKSKSPLENSLYEKRKNTEEKIQNVLQRRRELQEKLEKEENTEEKEKLEKEFNSLEKERESLERELGECIEGIEKQKEQSVQDSPYSAPTTVVREVVREAPKETANEDIKKEIARIVEEKEKLKKQQEEIEKKKEEEKKEQLKEIRAKEKEIEKEKEVLDKKEKEAKSDEEKEEIRKRKGEMEEELRRLIQEETSEKWEKRISEIENKVASVNEKYQDLTQKEKNLRSQIRKIETWGPESRKEDRIVDEYRSLYKKPHEKKEEVALSKNKEKEEKTGFFASFTAFLKSLKPSKDFFLKPPLLLAIDISDYSIETFAINEQKKTSAFGRVILEEGVVYNGEIRESEKLRKAFSQLLQNTKPHPIKREKDRRIKGVVSLPESKVFVQQIKVKKDDNILEKVKAEIERSIPVSPDDLYFHYHAIETSKEEKIILSVSIEKRIVSQYIDFLRSVDIDPAVFDFEAASLGRVFLKEKTKEKGKEKKEETSRMIVDIGARSTTISVFRKNVLALSVSTPFGGAYFTERIAKTLEIEKEEAESKKKRLGLRGEARDVLIEALEKIVQEVRGAQNYYEREFSDKVTEVTFSGGSSLLPGVYDYFKDELGEGVSIGDPFLKIKGPRDLDKKEGLLYANVIGLAIRTVGDDPIEEGFNLLPEKIRKKEKRHRQERKMATRFGAGFVAVFGLAVLAFAVYYAYRQVDNIFQFSSSDEIVEEFLQNGEDEVELNE